jgi:hypothetical protein
MIANLLSSGRAVVSDSIPHKTLVSVAQMAKKKTETVVVTWRVKEALRRRLEAAAARNEVSVNNEITRRIEESFTRTGLAGLAENVDRLSTIYERARASDEMLGRYRDFAQKCLELARLNHDPKTKLTMLSLANAWLALAARASGGSPTSDDAALGLDDASAPAETDEEWQARLRASADELLENAERSDARSAHDLGAEPREWDTRSVARSAARSRPRARQPHNETDEQRQARLRATAEGYRRNAKRHEARGAHDKAAEAREYADELERDARAAPQGQARSVSDQEPELPMPRQKGRTRPVK